MINIRTGDKKVSYLFIWLFLIGILGGTAVFFWLNTHRGIGISPDSILYISVARNLLQGSLLFSISPQGVLTPLSHYPPFYPLLLSVVGLILNQEPLYAVKWLNLIIIVANMVICSTLIYKATNKSWGFTFLGCALIMTSIPPFLKIHITAWTEPLYILLGLLGLLLLAVFFTKLQYRFLVGSALIVGLAFMTRYVGITLILTGCLCLLFYDKKPMMKRLLDVVLFGAFSSLFMVGFLIRNKLFYDVTTNRNFTFHPIHSGHITQLTSTVTFAYTFISILLLLVLTLCAFLLAKEKQYSWKRLGDSVTPIQREILVLSWYIIIYVSFLIFSISFIDAYTPLDDRILSPIYIPLVIITMYVFSRIYSVFHSIRIVKWLIVLSLIFILTLQIRNLVFWTNVNYRYGVSGYTDNRWINSSIMEKISHLPDDSLIFTNGYDVLYLWTDRISRGLPIKYSATSLIENQNYSKELIGMAQTIRASNGFIIYFDNIGFRSYYPTEQELMKALDLQIYVKADDGTIYQLNSD